MTRISSRDKNFKNAFTEINVARIIISLRGPRTECVALTTKCFASAAATVIDELLSTHLFIASTCPAHDVLNFIDFD